MASKKPRSRKPAAVALHVTPPSKYPVQPPRGPTDGAISSHLHEDRGVLLQCVQDGKHQHLYASTYNAWRLFGALALVLGIELPARLGKAIRMSEPDSGPNSITFGFTSGPRGDAPEGVGNSTTRGAHGRR